MIIRLNAYSDYEAGDKEPILVNMDHAVWVVREDRSNESAGHRPFTKIKTGVANVLVHETLEQIAEKMGGCP